jgi:predicted nucleic acid-binding protein
MKILLDTNILIRVLNSNHRDNLEIREALELLVLNEHELALVPQNLYEYFVVATRPVSANSFGLNSVDANYNIDRAIALFHLMLDERGIFGHWKSLVSTFSVIGKTGHDARLVAAMIRHGVSHLITFNTTDFSRFTMIKASTPRDVIANPF